MPWNHPLGEENLPALTTEERIADLDAAMRDKVATLVTQRASGAESARKSVSAIHTKTSMPKLDKELQHSLTHWFSGLMKGLESVEPPARATILRACGQACAASYTAEVFQHAREQSADMEGLLARLAAAFPEATYTLLASNTIRVCYTHCACDLVRCG